MRTALERAGEGQSPVGCEPRSSVRTMPWWAYAGGAAVVAGLTGLAIWSLLAEAGGDAGLRIEAVRTGLTVGLGAGGGFALVINARRQWLQERAHIHQERVDAIQQAHQERLHAHQTRVDAAAQAHRLRQAEAAERDAAERRITELYNAAAEQLGSDKAPVRLTALYTLERLANDNSAHRQTIVNIVCAYLRMPYTPPRTPSIEEQHRERARQHSARYRAACVGLSASAEPAVPPGPDPYEELQVRLAAQRILHTHLHANADVHWENISLDLTGATLTDFTLAHGRIRTATFHHATFYGVARFDGVRFGGHAWFDGAFFTEGAWFDGAFFTEDARFGDATFSGDALFGEATISRGAWFDGASFSRSAWFDGASFSGGAWFDGASFSGHARFTKASFSEGARFGEASFSGGVRFEGASFSGGAWFGEASFSEDAWFTKASFSGDTRFGEASFSEDARFDRASFAEDAWFTNASFSEDARFDGVSFSGGARFDRASFAGGARFNATTFASHVGLGAATFSPEGIELDAAIVADARLTHLVPENWRILPTEGTKGRFVQATTPPPPAERC